MARFDSPSGGTLAAIGLDSCEEARLASFGVDRAQSLTSSPSSTPDNFLALLTNTFGASNTRTIFSSAPETNWTREVKATEARG